MTKAENIAAIQSRLAQLTEEQTAILSDFAQALSEDATGDVRALSNREKQLLQHSKSDFENGRTVTLEQCRARTDALLARHRALRP